MNEPTIPTNGGTPNPNGTEGGSQPAEPVLDPAAVLAKNKELLEQNRKLKERASLLEKDRKDREEAALREKEDWKTLAENRAKELEETTKRVSDFELQERNRAKLSAFLRTLGAEVDRKYWDLIDIDKIVINPDTREVDSTSVTQAVDVFRKEHAILIQPKRPTGQPTDAPRGSTPGLNYDEWRNLPGKEMRARYKEMKEKDKQK